MVHPARGRRERNAHVERTNFDERGESLRVFPKRIRLQKANQVPFERMLYEALPRLIPTFKRDDVILCQIRRANKPDLPPPQGKVDESRACDNQDARSKKPNCSVVAVGDLQAGNVEIEDEIVSSCTVAVAELDGAQFSIMGHTRDHSTGWERGRQKIRATQSSQPSINGGRARLDQRYQTTRIVSSVGSHWLGIPEHDQLTYVLTRVHSLPSFEQLRLMRIRPGQHCCLVFLRHGARQLFQRVSRIRSGVFALVLNMEVWAAVVGFGAHLELEIAEPTQRCLCCASTIRLDRIDVTEQVLQFSNLSFEWPGLETSCADLRTQSLDLGAGDVVSAKADVLEIGEAQAVHARNPGMNISSVRF